MKVSYKNVYKKVAYNAFYSLYFYYSFYIHKLHVLGLSSNNFGQWSPYFRYDTKKQAYLV